MVDLSKAAKDYAESRFGAPIMAKAHATWQEAPTCDHFCDRTLDIGQTPADVSRYDYGKPYSWSSTIRENMSACGDYFRWNEFLSGAGTDHPEGGYLDRNYYAQAFAASLGNLNPFEKAYCACWGSPAGSHPAALARWARPTAPAAWSTAWCRICATAKARCSPYIPRS